MSFFFFFHETVRFCRVLGQWVRPRKKLVHYGVTLFIASTTIHGTFESSTLMRFQNSRFHLAENEANYFSPTISFPASYNNITHKNDVFKIVQRFLCHRFHTFSYSPIHMHKINAFQKFSNPDVTVFICPR